MVKEYEAWLTLQKRYKEYGLDIPPYPRIKELKEFIEMYFEPGDFGFDFKESDSDPALKSHLCSDANMSGEVEKIKTLENEIKELTAKTKEFEETLAKKEEEINRLKEELDNAKKTIEELEKTKEELERSIKEKDEVIAKIEAEQKEAILEKLKKLDDDFDYDAYSKKSYDELKARYTAVLEAKLFSRPELPKKAVVAAENAEKESDEVVTKFWSKLLGGER